MTRFGHYRSNIFLLFVLVMALLNACQQRESLTFIHQNGSISTSTEQYKFSFEDGKMNIATPTQSVSLALSNANDALVANHDDVIELAEIYDKTDLKLYDKSGNVAYDFTLKPGANSEAIQMQVAANAYLNAEGNLILPIDGGQFVHSAPISYQEIDGEKVEVESRFVLADATVSFELGDYNADYAVVIDPTITFTTIENFFVGLETVRDNFTGIAYDNNTGTQNWLGDWTESGDDGNANSGDINIVGGELRMDNDDFSPPSLRRQVDLSTAFSAELSLDIRNSANLEADDQIVVEVSSDGVSFNTLETFSGNITDGTRTYDIFTFASATTTVRLRISQGYSGTGEFVYFDNVQVLYDTSPLTGPGNNLCVNNTEIGGVVFVDANFDALQGIQDQSLSGVTVNAYDANGLAGSDITDGDGAYLITGLTANGNYRIEIIVPSGYEEGPEGMDSKTSVQFVQAGTCNASLGLVVPSSYCQDNPSIVVPCYEPGNASANANPGVVSFPYNSSGGTPTGITGAATIAQVGTTWGVAFQPSTQRVFASSFTKRHSGFGPEGIGGVYVLDFSSGSGSLLTSFDLQGVAPANGGATIDLGSVDRTGINALNDNPTVDTYDTDAFDKAGKTSYGDADLFTDGNTLWMVNLNQRALISVDVSNPMSYPGTVNQYPIDNFAGVPSCANGVLRPWGLAFEGAIGYLGCVCTAENGGTSNDLTAYVLSFDPTDPTSFTTVLSFDLDYSREPAIDFPGFGLSGDGEWLPWAENWAETGFGNAPNSEVAYPQPILADIEFTEDGSMILGLSDRFGHQMGTANYIPVSPVTNTTSGDVAGDIIKACKSGSSFTLEGNGGCSEFDSGNTSAEVNDGPLGTGEFFYNDAFDDPSQNPQYNHNETALGGMLILKGKYEVAAAHFDPFDNSTAFDAGIVWHSTINGARTNEFMVIETGVGASKSNALGDMIAVCNPAPIEIGNYVWLDTNGNGAQDPGESPLNGVTVELYEGATLVGQATTNSNGEYYFGGLNNQNMLGVNELTPNTNYEIRITLVSAQSSNPSIVGPTTANTVTDNIDSDGVLDGGGTYVTYSFTTGNNGESDYTLDFGFTTFICVAPTFQAPVITTGDCTGAFPNNNAAANITILANGDRADISSSGAVFYDGDDYTNAEIINGGQINFANLEHNTQYIVRIYNTDDACFVDVTLSVPAIICSIDCTVAPVCETVVTAASGNSNVTNILVNVPVGTVAGDLLVATIATDGVETITANSDWTLINQGTQGGVDPTLAVFYRIATGTEPANYSFGISTAEEVAASIFRYTGVDQANPIRVFGVATGSSNTPTAPDVTATIEDVTVVRIVAVENNLTINGIPANNTSKVNLLSSNTTGAATLVVSETTLVNGGATGTGVFTIANSTVSNWRAMTLVLTPDTDCAKDYGDLADSGDGTGSGNYETQSANGGPSHAIDNNIKLGATIDSESDGQQSALADGDGADEDGISFPTFTAGQSAIVTVSLMNMTGGNANLYGFIDWNNDGDFDDTDESPAAVVVADQVASAMITFNVPAGAVTGTNLGARFRLTTDDLSLLPEASEGAASNGEVEDYLVQVNNGSCDVNITNLTLTCVDADNFTVSFDVEWNYALATSETIIVELDGQAVSGSGFTPSGATGSQAFSLMMQGPDFDRVLTANFSTTTTCTASTTFDLVPDATCAPACVNTLGGTVFNDINNDGVEDAAEIGQPLILVEIYECDATTPTLTTYTNVNGDWSVDDAGLTYPVRVEFVIPASLNYLQPSAAGTDNGTDVQFVTASSCEVDFGVVNPDDYCQADPTIAFSCFTPGDISSNPEPSIGTIPLNATMSSQISADVNGNTYGSIYGLAYDRSKQMMYSSAFLKRHVGLASSGLGAIYSTDYSTVTPTTSLLVVVPNVGTVDRTGGNALPASISTPSTDADAFGKIGKVGLGDIDVSADGNTLYTVNLNTRQLVIISDVMTTPSVSEIAIASAPNCNNGLFRPLGVKVYRGKVYVGGVCTGENGGSAADINASVHEYNPSNGTWSSVLSFDLTSPAYNHGDVVSNANAALAQCTEWETWVDDYSERNLVVNAGAGEPALDPTGNFEIVGGGITGADFRCRAQAMIADIEFTTDGYMLIALMDRTGHQFGYQQYPPTGAGTSFNGGVVSANNGGDMLIAYNNSGTWVLESNASLPSGRSSAGANNNQGPAGGEFFYQNQRAAHEDADAGGIVQIPGTNLVLAAVLDPNDGFGGGISYSDVTNGTTTRNDLLISDPALNVAGLGKANGIGDLEALCDPLPIQVGNYVWNDADGDGTQDACEDAISGLTVKLYDANGLLVGVDVTDANGEYYFDQTNVDINGVNANGTATIGFTGLTDGAKYFIVFMGDSYNGTTDEITVGGTTYSLTSFDSGEGNNPDQNDSDVSEMNVPNVGDMPVIMFTADEIDHTFDAGLISNTPILGAIGNYVWLDEDSNGLQDEGEAGIPNVQVDLKDMNGTVIATTYTDSDGEYLFPNLPAAMYFVDVVESTLPAGVSQTTTFTNVVDGADADTDNDDGDLGNKDQSQNGGYKITLDSGEENLTADFGYNYNPTDDVNNPTGSPVAALGDRVWIDSDGDGVQDPNEVGVEGVEVTLMGAGPDGIFGTGDDVTATTTTDENGNYLFDGLTPGAYMVTVTDDAGASHDILDGGQYDQTGDPDHFAANESTAPAGTANDNKATRPVILGPGDVFLNVDFGYQPEAGTMLGSIGNTIWLDADADGNAPDGTMAGVMNGDAVNGAGVENDNNEQPISGVSVALIKDTNGNGVWEAGEPIVATDVTDAKGQYLFEDLPITDGAGSDDYIVWVTDTDNVLDGLKPTYDADGGVVTTGSSAPLGNPTATLGISAVSDLTATPVTDQDFGYTPDAQDAGEGLIGDYVWFDTNRDGVQDANESGIEGVLMELYDLGADEQVGGGDDVLIATTTTDENGYYYFGGLTVDAGGEGYQVKVATSNFTAGQPLEGLENTFDPNDGTTNPDNMGGAVSLTSASPINLDQDFGYVGDDAGTLGSIGNKVFEDLNANGVRDAGEAGINGVTIDLYRDLNGDGQINPGEPRVGTKTTQNLMGQDGMYLFDELPLGDYVVDVTDEAGLLNGYWHSLGSQNAGSGVTGNTADDANGGTTGDNSKSDAFAVTIDGTVPNNLNVDFGYYVDPASVGNYVWEDLNANGLQDDGETGINGVQVTLMITYPDNTMSTIVTTTLDDADGNAGFYEFPNLLLDEDYNGLGTVGSEPVHTIKVDAAQTVFTNANLVPTTANVNSNGNDLADSDDFAGVEAAPVQGNQNTAAVDPSTNENEVASYDFGVRQVVDLATIIQITSTTPAQGYYDNDDPITFKVTVANQGGQAVSDVTVTNYLPATLENAALVASSLMINGNPAPAGVTITKVGNVYVIDFGTNTADWLQPTDVLMFSFTADITDGTTPGTVITNTVEISSFDTDNDSNTDAPTDDDSLPNTTDENNDGENPESNGNDDVLDNTNDDEDDHDIAVLTTNLVLPVELVAFRAEAKSDYIALTWTTASELNNDRFEIERSEDAKSFKQLGTVKGKGTTLETTDYSFEDRTAIPGVLYYYRLKQVDTDGVFDYSDIRVAQLAGDIQEMLIYPSPLGSGQKLNVRLYTENARVEFVIADMQNRVAKVFKLDVPQNGWNIFELEVQDLPSGSYFLTGSEGQLGGFVKTNE